MRFAVLQTLNGLSLSAVLFLISIGFNIIIGLMRIINLSHATLFVLAAHIGVEVLGRTGSFLAAIVAGGLSAALIGVIIERFLIVRMYGRRFEQVLMTMGIMFIVDDITLMIWGGYAVRTPAPAILSGPITILGVIYPLYRFAMIGFGVIAAVLMWLLIDRTKFGAYIRAGADNSEMIQAMGINVRKVFLLSFGLGALLVGLAGVLSSPLYALQPGMSMNFLSLAIVVITIGGIGSLPGVMVGSLFVGLIDSFGKAFFPELSYFTMFVPMVLVLVIRPQGLLGRLGWS